MSKQFYNTVDLTADQLADAKAKTKIQEETVLNIFRKYPVNGLTPYECHEIYESIKGETPRTSIGRAITNLTQIDKALIKTNEKRKGKYKYPNWVWRINQPKQLSLFDEVERPKTIKQKINACHNEMLISQPSSVEEHNGFVECLKIFEKYFIDK
jgi:hypothetical protein